MVKQRGSLFLLFALLINLVFSPYPAKAEGGVNGVSASFLNLKTLDYKLDATIAPPKKASIYNTQNIDITWIRAEGMGTFKQTWGRTTQHPNTPIIKSYRIDFLAAGSNKIDQARMASDAAYARDICAGDSGWRIARHGDNNSKVEGNDIKGVNVGADSQGRINWEIRAPFKGTYAITEPGYFRVVATGITEQFEDQAKAAKLTMPQKLTCSTIVIEPPLVAPEGKVILRTAATDKEGGKELNAKILVDGKSPRDFGATKDTTPADITVPEESIVDADNGYVRAPDTTKKHTITFELDGYKPVTIPEVYFHLSRRIDVALAKTSSDAESTVSDKTDVEVTTSSGQEASDQAAEIIECGKYLGFQGIGDAAKSGQIFKFEPGRYFACQLLITFKQLGKWMLEYGKNVPY